MKNHMTRIKAYLLRKALKIVGIIFGFGSISFFIMCKYGDFIEYTRIKGKVSSLKSGQAIPNIQVTIKNHYDTVRTDATGEYQLDHIFPNEIHIKAEDIDGLENGEFQILEKTLSVNPSQTVNCDFALDPK